MGFEEGVSDALRRLSRDCPFPVPAWLVHPDFYATIHEVKAMQKSAPDRCVRLARQLQTAIKQLRGHALSESDPTPAADITQSSRDPELCAATLRLLAGDLLEASAERRVCSDTCKRKSRKSRTEVACNTQLRAQNMADTYNCAVWTSAHAEYIFNASAFGSALGKLSPPSCASVPCAAAAYDLTDLFARRGNVKSGTTQAAALLAILQRATSPGQRGWDGVVQKGLKHRGTAAVISQAVLICLLGLHPQIEPCKRPSWKQRFITLRMFNAQMKNDKAEVVLGGYTMAIKEAVRCRMSDVAMQCFADYGAFCSIKHPLAHLHVPPVGVARAGQLASMAKMVQVGVEFGQSGEPFAVALRRVFAPCVKRGSRNTWHASWMGKGTANIPKVHLLKDAAASVWAQAFDAAFLPFWTFCAAQNIQLSHVDSVQHTTLNNANAATLLCAQLPLLDALAVQRVALSTPCAAMLSPQEAAHCLGIATDTAKNTATHTTEARDHLHSLMKAGSGIHGVAKLLLFARVAAVREHLLVIDLGLGVAAKQARAVLRRFAHFEEETAVLSDAEVLDLAKTHLSPNAFSAYICCSCKRLATAHTGSSKEKNKKRPFSDIGVSSCMVNNCAASQNDGGDLVCAKRATTSVRNAMSTAARMGKHPPECVDVEEGAIRSTLLRRNVEVAACGRMRRNVKTAFEFVDETALCGNVPMLVVPLLGSLARINGTWMTLCTVCGCAVRVNPSNRYADSIACMRCDASMLCANGDGATLQVDAKKRDSQKICRFCGAVDPERTGVRWRKYEAPHDIAGPNGLLPQPLRTVHYCPRHARPWLQSAHRVLQTRAILAHIAHGAKPVIGTSSETTERQSDMNYGTASDSACYSTASMNKEAQKGECRVNKRKGPALSSARGQLRRRSKPRS